MRKIERIEKLTSDSVRALCIKNGWCDRMDCMTYQVLLDKADEELSDELLLDMAELIYEYSSYYEGENDIESLEDIMFWLNSAIIRIFNIIEE